MGGLTNKAARRAGDAIRKVERQRRSQVAPRRPIVPTGGGKKCNQVLRILVMGSPTGGKIVIPVTIGDGDEEDVEITLPATTTQIVTAFESHPDIDEGQVEVTSASGGTAGLAQYEVSVKFKDGLRLRDVELGTVDDTFMTGGNHTPYTVIRKCCG